MSGSEKFYAMRTSARDARASPPLVSGTIWSSSTEMPASTTTQSSASLVDRDGLKFHFWRTISR
jgi:hypothetical protein